MESALLLVLGLSSGSRHVQPRVDTSTSLAVASEYENACQSLSSRLLGHRLGVMNLDRHSVT